LLRKACRKFQNNGFKDTAFYLVSADSLPFYDKAFDVCICHLSFNFFPDLIKVIQEISRVTGDKAIFLGSVPVPEKNQINSKIRGQLYSENELKTFFEEEGWNFKTFPLENGCLLYFRAEKSRE